MSAISNRAWTPPGNPVQSKRESLKEANVHFISSVIAHRLLPVLTFQTVFLCGLFHTFHELATFCPQNPSAFLKKKRLHKRQERTSLYKQSDNVHPRVCACVENIHQSLPVLLLLSKFTSVIPTPGTISK